MFQNRRLDITNNHKSFIPDVDLLDSHLSCFLFQVVMIYSVCRIFSIFGLYYKQPTVIFEIVGGIVLGPSCLGRIDIFSTTIFPKASLTYIKVIAQFGLQVYLFLVGLELDLNLMLQQIKTTGVIALVSMSVPFGAGMAIAVPLYEYVKVDQTAVGASPAKHNLMDLSVFIGTAMSITALPVLARILKENFLMLTVPGSIAFGAAVITDALAWILLVIAIALANAKNSGSAGWVLFAICIYAVLLFTAGRYIVESVVQYVERKYPESNQQIANTLMSFLIICMYASAWVTSMFGIEAIIGSFMFGLIVPRSSRIFHVCTERLEVFVHVIMLPLYFAQSGLSTDFTVLQSYPDLPLLIAVIAVATLGKVLGAGIPSYLLGIPLRESAVIAVLMNTRGLVELIVLNIGLNQGVLNQRVFSIMVIMCLFTTFITCPIVHMIYPMELRDITSKFDLIPSLSEVENQATVCGLDIAKDPAIDSNDDTVEHGNIELIVDNDRTVTGIETIDPIEAVNG